MAKSQLECIKVSYAVLHENMSMTLYLEDGRGFTLDLSKFPMFENLEYDKVNDFVLNKNGISWPKLKHNVSYKGFFNLCRAKMKWNIIYDG